MWIKPKVVHWFTRILISVYNCSHDLFQYILVAHSFSLLYFIVFVICSKFVNGPFENYRYSSIWFKNRVCSICRMKFNRAFLLMHLNHFIWNGNVGEDAKASDVVWNASTTNVSCGVCLAALSSTALLFLHWLLILFFIRRIKCILSKYSSLCMQYMI